MERDVTNKDKVSLNDLDERPRSAVNAAVLDYYKKFGRKRDLEQYFSLSTAQSEIRDPSSLFWRRMKEQSDTSDSGEKKSESSNEICRISIQCSIPRVDTQRQNSPPKSDSESPPIITDVLPGPSHSGDDSIDDNNSHKSIDGTLDTSINKPLSPTSSVTSQRKLEWDSLADVGYGNESDRKTSASSLSTLEREILAQKQQFTLDFKQNSDLGLPTAHSTPVDPNENKPKNKKGQGKKTTSFSKKDVDIVEVKLPHNSENAQAINVNLTKQFSVNLGKGGGITVEPGKNNVTVIPETKCVDTEISPAVRLDKEIQTSLLRSKESSANCLETEFSSQQNVPVYICLNTIKKRHKRKNIRKLRSKNVIRKRSCVKMEPAQEKEKSGEQVSEAESFEYMPGHIYNQNQLIENSNMPSNNNAGNKSSLESSAVHTTDSSKESKCSFTKELDKSLDVLKLALKDKYDSNLKKKLVKEVIQRLLKSNYADDGSTPDFLSVLSLHSKKTPTTSTSEADNSGEKMMHTKPKKSILRNNRFNSKDIASTSQSAPNLPFVMNSENPVLSYLPKQSSSPSTDTDPSANYSAKELSSSDTIFAKTSSEELLKKYIDALKKEEAYKQHLKDKHLFLRQKLLRSDTGLKLPVQLDLKTNNKLKDLIKDLTRNNYDDGSGDASKLEGGSSSNFNFQSGNRAVTKQRSHSVFTLSSGNPNLQNRNCYPTHEHEIPSSSRAGPSHRLDHIEPYQQHACKRTNVADSSVQVSMKCVDEDVKKYSTEVSAVPIRTITGLPALNEDVKYVCLCTEKSLTSQNSPEEFLIYKCSKLPGNMISTGSNTVNVPFDTKCTSKHDVTASSTENKSKLTPEGKPPEAGSMTNLTLLRKLSKASQTNNFVTSNTPHKLSARSASSSSSEHEINNCAHTPSQLKSNNKKEFIIKESTRCLQTEISIHPKISDPALSDVNIINSVECVKLISELYRKVSRSSSERNIPDRPSENNEAHTCAYSKSSKENIHLWHKQSRDNLSADEKDIAPMTNQPPACSSCHSTMPQLENNDKIIIPIDGTNMTLKVSIAGKSSTPSLNTKKNQTQTEASCFVDSENKEIITNRIENTENYTCITAECSKSVQSENVPNIFKNNECYLNEGKPVEGPRLNTYKLSNSSSVNQCYRNIEKPVVVIQSNTYPKTIPMKDRKLFLRHNTEISINTEAVRPIHLDSENNDDDENKGDKETQPVQKNLLVENKKQSKQKGNSELQSQKKNEFSSDHNSVSENPKACSQKTGRSSSLFVPESKNFKSNMAKEDGTTNDMILDMIQDITKRYSKKISEKSSKKKCYEEILRVLDYLLDTDESGDSEKEPAKDSQSSEEQPRVSETLSNKLSPDTGALNKCSNLKPSMNPYKTMYKEYALQYVNTANNFENTSTQPLQPVSYESIKIPKNISDDQSDASKESLKQKTDAVDNEFSVSMKQGFHGYSGAKKKRSKEKTDVGNKELSVYSGAEKSDWNSCPETCSIKCGCDEPECQDRAERGDENYKTDILKATLRSVQHDTDENDKQSSGSSKSESMTDFTELKTDKGRKMQFTNRKTDVDNKKSLVHEKLYSEKSNAACSSHEPECEVRSDRRDENYKTEISKATLKSVHHETEENYMESSESLKSESGSTKLKTHEGRKIQRTKQKPDVVNRKALVYEKPSSVCKKHEPLENCPEKCDIACGCDEPDCNENYKTDIKKPTLRSIHQETEEFLETTKQESSEQLCPQFCDIACGCDEPSSQDISERGVENYKTDNTNRTYKSLHQGTNETLSKTCDKGVGCEDCLEQDSSSCDCIKYIKNRCDHTTCKKHKSTDKRTRNLVSKCVQSTARKVKLICSHRHCSSQCPVTSDHQSTCTDSPTAKIINKIRKECEKYQKRSRTHINEVSSSTSANCDHCNRANWHCSCRGQKCRGHRTRTTTEKIKKKGVAYNLVLQTSDSVASEEQIGFDRHCRPMQNIILKVPKPKQAYVPFKELSAKIEQNFTGGISQRCCHKNRSRSWPHEGGISSTDDVKMAQARTVRDYLESNRPDFVERCTDRQNCIRTLSRSRPESCSLDSPRLKMIVIHNPNCGGCTGPTTMYCGGVPMSYNCPDPCLQTVQNEVTRFGAGGYRKVKACLQLRGAAPWRGTLPCVNLQQDDVANASSFNLFNAIDGYIRITGSTPTTDISVMAGSGKLTRVSMTASERSKQFEVLSMQLRGLQPQRLTEVEMRHLAKEVGLGQRRTQPKLFSEREMKKHSEKIYKSLPEVKQKKEDAKKESIKRTNLLMASLFKKNLQKKTLRGAVNLSNYSAVIKL